MDGIEQQPHEQNPKTSTYPWKIEKMFLIPQSSNVIGIECTDEAGHEGILASLEDGQGNIKIMTDSSWKCSSSEQAGWSDAEFILNSNDWKDAKEVAQHGEGPWDTIGSISPEAKWIWAKDHPELDGTSYCRVKIPQGKEVSLIYARVDPKILYSICSVHFYQGRFQFFPSTVFLPKAKKQRGG